MTATALRAALERRYDGPQPPDPSVWPDHDKPWRVQRGSRRQRAWQTVRKTSQATLAAKRYFQDQPSVEAYRRWRIRRHALAHALSGWKYFRDLDRGQ